MLMGTLQLFGIFNYIYDVMYSLQIFEINFMSMILFIDNFKEWTESHMQYKIKNFTDLVVSRW